MVPGAMMLLSSILAQSLMMVNLPCAQCARARQRRTTRTHDDTVLSNFDEVANLRSLEDGPGANGHIIANLDGVVAERAAGDVREYLRSDDGWYAPLVRLVRRSYHTALIQEAVAACAQVCGRRQRSRASGPMAITTACPVPALRRSPRTMAEVWMMVLPPRMMF